ncbi:MAG: ion transporter [bacterium]
MDANDSIYGPTTDNNLYVTALFVIFIMIGSIVCVNLFVAMISLKFQESYSKN